MWGTPIKPTNPGQWKVIGCFLVPLLFIAAIGMIIYGKVTGNEVLLTASASFLGLATVAGIISYFMNRYS